MCGICGILRLNDRAELIDPSDLLMMRDRMTYRGPDDSGLYQDEWIGLGSRRLAILDLSPRGHMPMSTPDGRYTIIYNGEVYNFGELRQELVSRGEDFCSRTDTEVLLHLYKLEGSKMLKRCNGMFAMAIWDALEQHLFLARDRLGVKPLYYVVQDHRLYWGSEEKVLFAAGVQAVFDENTWPELLCFRYVSGERTPFRNIIRLLPGHFMEVKAGQVRVHRWWSMEDVVKQSAFHQNASQAAEHGLALFQESIRLRRISDVPVGVLLSGGLDSGGIASVMAEQAGHDVESFTVRFSESTYDEGDLARQVAERWGLKYHEMYVPPATIPSLLQEATYLLDEPLVHGNDLHILAISRYAKPLVTVLLSGEGADEIFGGYVRYRFFLYNTLLRALAPLLGGLRAILPFQGRSKKTLELFSFPNQDDRLAWSSAEVFPGSIGLSLSLEALFPYRYQLARQAQKVYDQGSKQAMFYEQHTYLQSVLDRNDRMTMGASIECREPYLDVHLVEWAAGLPQERLFEKGIGKAVLRRAFHRYLPPDIIKHKKWGFGVPWRSYFRENPILRGWVEKLPSQSVFTTLPQGQLWVKENVKNFIAGDNSLTALIRQFVMISIWHNLWIENQAEPLVERTPSQQIN